MELLIEIVCNARPDSSQVLEDLREFRIQSHFNQLHESRGDCGSLCFQSQFIDMFCCSDNHGYD